MNIKKNSWHYRLYETYGCNPWVPYDICGYTRGVAAGILAVCFLILISSLFGSIIIDFLMWSYINLFVGNLELSGGAFTFVIAFGFLLAVTLLKLITDSYIGNDNFLTEAYKSHKDKYCIKVKVEE